MSNDTIPSRICKTCQREFPATVENFRPYTRNGEIRLTYMCRDCYRQYKRDWASENPDKVSAHKKKWRKENPDKVKAEKKRSHVRRRDHNNARTKRWYYANIEYVIISHHEYYLEHKDEIIMRVKEYYQENKEERKAYIYQWQRDNRDKTRMYSRASSHKRRALLLIAEGGDFTVADVKLQYKSQRGKCWHCGKPVGDEYHVDHLYPIARGGHNGARNIVVSCPHCNLSKGAKTVWEWMGRLL